MSQLSYKLVLWQILRWLSFESVIFILFTRLSFYEDLVRLYSRFTVHLHLGYFLLHLYVVRLSNS